MDQRIALRAVTMAAAGLVAACGTTTATPPQGGPPSQTPPAATSSSGPAAQASRLPADPDGVGSTATARPEPATLDAATRFVRAWARPHLPAERWLADLQPLAVAGYADLLATVDPANVPARRVTGAGRVATAIDGRVDVDVPTDAGPLRVAVVREGTRWLVATIAPEPGEAGRG
ncbi:hypothetical protein [Verrucosispora sp. WMMD1129]|uniref:hypothetical protein n=1 Tax=Verrucosispora sp. WMMD1129 TaxID=3016093 RepID=UPI00249A5A1D|nr:hypothetical protein [Verrucosispora sp. WMMD1129]WFE47665.1 hypothetical protein O7624_26730 [Verrucosispora sp. WMMD1129]